MREVAARARARGTLAIGSTRDEILGVLGTPSTITRVIHDHWAYGFSFVEIDDAGKLVELYEADVPLHVMH